MGQSAQQPMFTPFGSVFEPIGYVGGKPVWPVMGGNGEGENSDGAQGGTDDSGQGSGDAGDGSGANGSGQSTDNTGGEREVTREEFDRLRAQLSAADKNKSDAQKALEMANAKLKEFEDRDKSELEKAQSAAEAATKKSTELETKLRDFAKVEAFRAASEAAKPALNWHNTKVAMSQLDSDLYEIDADGNVTGMEKAVAALAKDHGYLLKTEKSGGGGRSGGSYNNGSGGGSGNSQLDRKKLEQRFPSLRGRGGNA